MEPNREWRITVEPDDGAGEVTVALPATAPRTEARSRRRSRPRCPRDASSETAVTSSTARFADVPALHVGDAFSFELRFSEAR